MELGPGIGVACSDVDGNPQELWPIEREAVLKAIPRRQREFAAGRLAAREAMVQIGWSLEAIPSAPDRSPIWPKGLVGSIAHSGTACVAITGRGDTVHAMGLDIEEDKEMDPTLWATICTPEELAAVTSLPKSERGRCVTRMFCAKEAYYKWQFPQTQRMLDFLDVQVSFSNEHRGFSAHPAVTSGLSILSCARKGRVLTSCGVVLALLVGPPASKLQDEFVSSLPEASS